MENIKNVLRHFAQFYGQGCWFNGRDGIKELPSDEEFIDIYAKQLMDIFNKNVNEPINGQFSNNEIEEIIEKMKENDLKYK